MAGGHTPGPWTAEAPMDGWVVRAADPHRPGKRIQICEIGPPYRSARDQDQADANCRLIAAAPAMLDALRELCAWYGPFNPTRHPPEINGAWMRAKAAIATANGEAA